MRKPTPIRPITPRQEDRRPTGSELPAHPTARPPADRDAIASPALPGRTATREETAAVANPARAFPNARAMAVGGGILASGMRSHALDAAYARRQALEMRGAGYVERHRGAGIGHVDESRAAANLPAVISSAIQRSGDRSFQPRWHMLFRMPGFRHGPIRAMGEALLGEFTRTSIMDVQTVTTVTNDLTEVKALMTWIARNGTRQDVAQIDIGDILPHLPGGADGERPYVADVQKWSVDDYSFLVVKDEFGHYVYGWPRDQDLTLDNEPRPMLPGR